MAGGTPLPQLSQAFIPNPATAPPATVAGGGNWQSGILNCAGLQALAASCTLSQAGSIVIQRYIDPAGTIAIGTAISQVLTANTAAWVSVNDGLPAASWQVTISNTSGSTGNLTGVAFLAAFPSG